MHALFVILWSYCLCSLLNPPWCYDVWLHICVLHTGSCRLGWYGHWLRSGHDSSSSSRCPVACPVLVPLHVLVHVHILVAPMVLVLVRVRLGRMLALGWWWWDSVLFRVVQLVVPSVSRWCSLECLSPPCPLLLHWPGWRWLQLCPVGIMLLLHFPCCILLRRQCFLLDGIFCVI
jgi:hypothetical protein